MKKKKKKKKKRLSRGSLLHRKAMAFKGYVQRITILLIVSLHVSFPTIVPIAATDQRDSRAFGYDSYNLDKGPVFYEAYYPTTRHVPRYEKEHLNSDTVLERSFQIPYDRPAYQTKMANGLVSSKTSPFLTVDGDENLPVEFRQFRNDETAIKLDPFRDYSSTSFDYEHKNAKAVNIEEISKLVRGEIFRDLENWNALERYLDRVADRNRMIVYPGIQNRPNKDKEDILLRQRLDARDAKERRSYPEEMNANKNTILKKMYERGDDGVVVASTDITSDSLPLENIFQPRPQLIKYTFFKNPTTPRPDVQMEKEIAKNNRERRVEKNVEMMSIEISELPRHKTRHHHGEKAKRVFSHRA